MTDKPTIASYLTSSGVAVWGTLTFNQVMALIGTLLALATFGVNWYYQRRRDNRDAEYHGMRMRLEAAAREAQD